MVRSRQMLNSSAHSVSRTCSTDQTAGCLFLQSVVKTVNSSSYIQNWYLCYLQVVITFPSSSNFLKNSSIQEAKDPMFLNPDWSLHFLRMTVSNKKVDGPQVQVIRRMNHGEMQQTYFTSISTCWLHCKRCHNLCDKCPGFRDNCPGFHQTACESPDEKSFNYSCSAVRQSKTVAVHCCRPSWDRSLCCCLSSSWLFTCRQSFIVFFDVHLSTTSLHSFVFTWFAISDHSPCALQGVHSTFSPCPLICGYLLLMLSFRVLHF